MDDYGKVSFDIQSPGNVGFDVQSPGSANFDLGNARSAGTNDYNKLKNKPAINGHVLVGNQTASDLGLATPDDINIFTARYGITTENELSTALNAKKYIYVADNHIPTQLFSLHDVGFDSEAMVGEGYVFVFARLDGTTLKRVQLKYGVWSTLNDIELAESSAKLDVYQGTEYAGQPMVVGSDGYVAPMDSGGLLVEDEKGNVWRFVEGAGPDGSVVIADSEGNLWHLPPGTGKDGDIPVADSEGNSWYLLSGAGYSADRLPPGGLRGDIMTRTGNGSGAAWVTPANDFTGDNTRPITAAAVNTIVGNIDALLATI